MPDSLRDSRQRGISKLILFPWRSLCLHGIALGWVSAGKLMLLTGNAVLILFLSQRLRLDTYGIFVAVVGAQVLVSRVLMLGVDAGMIRLKTVGAFDAALLLAGGAGDLAGLGDQQLFHPAAHHRADAGGPAGRHAGRGLGHAAVR